MCDIAMGNTVKGDIAMGNTVKGDIAMSNINKKQDWATNADWWENAFCNGSIPYHYKRMEWYKCPGVYVRTSEEARLVNLLKADRVGS